MRLKSISFVMILCSLLATTSFQLSNVTETDLRFDDSRTGPYVDRILYRIIQSEAERVQAMLDGEIDIIGGPIGLGYLDTLNASPNIELSSNLRNGYGKLTINCDKYPLNISAFRRAFAYALDKNRIADEVYGGKAIVHDSIIPRPNPLCFENDLPFHYYDNDTVIGNQILSDAGFIDINSDGWREAPDGSTFEVNIEYNAVSSLAGQVASFAAEALQELSINAQASGSDFYDYIARVSLHGDFDVVLLGSTFNDYSLTWLEEAYGTSYFGVSLLNLPNFRNETFDALAAIILHNANYTEISSAAEQIQEVLLEQCPEIICYVDYQYGAYRTDRFVGQIANQSQDIDSFWTNLKSHLSLPDGGPFSGTLRIALENEPDSFNPMVAVSSSSHEILTNLFDTLVRIGPSGEIMPWLAASYLIEDHAANPNVTAGHTRLTFDLISNASWSDGAILHAEDVAYTYYYYMMSGAYGSPMAIGLEGVVAAYASSPFQFVIEFDDESYWHIYEIASHYILPKNFLQSLAFSDWNAWDPVISSDPFITSGPFNLMSFSMGNYVMLSYHPLYSHHIRGTGSDQPTISSPEDMVVVDGTSGNGFTWSITDDNLLVQRIFVNGVLHSVSINDSAIITINLDPYRGIYGMYNFTVQVQDFEYQSAIDTVLVNVVPDTFAPEVNSPNDIEVLDVLFDGALINWTVFDHNPKNYTISWNGEVAISENWTRDTTNILYAIGSLTEGEYILTLSLCDVYGHISLDSINVVIMSDGISPEINHPEDVEMIVGTTGISILWNPTDQYPSTYEIYLDGVLNKSGNWDSDQAIVYSLDGFETGTYNITIYVSDISENVAVDWVAVRVNAAGFPIHPLVLVIGGISVLMVALVVLMKQRR